MDEPTQKILLRWWQSMMLPPTQLKRLDIRPAPTAHKAQLKRCECVDAAMLTEGFRALWLNLNDETTRIEQSSQKQSQAIECWATIAALLVNVPQSSEQKFAVAAGKKGDGDKSIVSELRFLQLQNAKTPEDFLRRLRRILQQLKGKGGVSVVNLAQDIQQWFAEHYQRQPRSADKRISVRWAMDYYRAAAGKK